MTELYGFIAPDVEEFVVAWLTPLGPTSVERPAGATLPYRMVNRVAGADDLAIFSDDPVVSVHTFAATRTQAKTEARITHRRMLVLANNPMTNVTITGGLANVEYLETFEGPYWVDYLDKTISRYVARYRLGFKFIAV